MNAPLSRFLVEFVDARPAELPELPTFPEPEAYVEPEPTIILTMADFEQKLRDVHYQAEHETRERIEAEMTLRLEAQRAEMQRGFEALREVWVTQEGERLNAGLTSAVAELEMQLSASLAEALRPLFADACRSRILTELGTALASILGDPSHPPVRIEGPVDLLTAFGKAHTTDVSIDYVVSDDKTELSIVTDTTRIETRLSACLAAFKLSEG